MPERELDFGNAKWDGGFVVIPRKDGTVVQLTIEGVLARAHQQIEARVHPKDWFKLLAELAKLDSEFLEGTGGEVPEWDDPQFQECYDPWVFLRSLAGTPDNVMDFRREMRLLRVALDRRERTNDSLHTEIEACGVELQTAKSLLGGVVLQMHLAGQGHLSFMLNAAHMHALDTDKDAEDFIEDVVCKAETIGDEEKVFVAQYIRDFWAKVKAEFQIEMGRITAKYEDAEEKRGHTHTRMVEASNQLHEAREKVKALEDELVELGGKVCDECDGDGWVEERTGRRPCICVEETGPYREALASQGILADVLVQAKGYVREALPPVTAQIIVESIDSALKAVPPRVGKLAAVLPGLKSGQWMHDKGQTMAEAAANGCTCSRCELYRIFQNS